MRSRSVLAVLCLVLVAVFGVATTGFAYDHKQIEARVAAGLEEFDKVVTNSEEVIDKAAGILVCPKISKIGLGIGVEKGNCALMVDGKTVEYWRTSGASIGATAGIQSIGTVVAFMTPEMLEKFRKSDRGWEAGVDGSVAVAKVGASGKMSTADMKDPIMGWIYSTKGLMADLSFAGSTYKRIGTEADVAKFEDPFHRFVVTAEIPQQVDRGGAQTLQMTLDIEGWVTIMEIEGMQSTIREGGSDAAKEQLSEMPALGEIRHSGRSMPIQYARAVQMGDRFRVMLATTSKMGFSWAEQQDTGGTVFQLDLDMKRLGSGVMVMNPTLGWDDDRGGVTVDQQDLRPIKLTSVSHRKID